MSGVGRIAKFPCGRWVKWLVVVFWVGALAAMGPLAGQLGDVQDNDSVNWLPESAESTQVYERSEAFQNPDEAPALIVYERPGGLTGADRELVAGDVAAFEALEKVDGEVVGPIESADGEALQLVVPVNLGEDGQGFLELPDFRDEVMAQDVAGDGLQMYFTGPAGFNADFAEGFEGVEGTLLIAAFIVVVVILLFTYRSPWLWILPALSAVVALVVAMGVIYLLAEHAGLVVNAQSQGILGVLVFGAGTDYALLLVARYREELRKHADRHEAMAFALHRSGPAIFASGMTVLLGMLCLLFAEMSSTASMGPVLAIGIGAGLLVMLTLLPALLVVVGRWIFWPVKPAFGSADPVEGGFWSRVGRGIAPRPRLVWVGTSLVLGALVLGVTQISDDGLSYEESFLDTPESVVGQQVLNEHFSAGAGDPLIVMAQADSGEDVAAVVRETRGVVPESVELAPPAGGLAYIEATLTDAPDGQAAKATVERVRDAVHEVDGAEAIVGGSTAVLLDTQNASARDNTVVMPITLAVVFVILMLLLRAIVAPLLLVGTVVLSFAATFGLGAIVFTHLFDFAGTDASLPLFVFVFLVALGIDYNIFLMTRVHEEARRVDARRAALIGLTATGAVITSAGLVLAGTFATMLTIPMVMFIQIGFLVAVGVLIDTMIVRSILVTALNLDLGRHMWWPSRLSKLPAQGGPPAVEGLSRAMTGPRPAMIGGAGNPTRMMAEAAMVGPGALAAGPAQGFVAVEAPAPAPRMAPRPVSVGNGSAGNGSVGNGSVGNGAPAAGSDGARGTMGAMSAHENLLAGPPPTMLPEVEEAKAMLVGGTDPAEVAARFPDYSAAWAALADAAYGEGRVVESYAYARTGYHRGLDALRRSGWRGHGPVPWEHEPNRGFLRSLHALGRAAAAIDEGEEARRCYTFLLESSAAAADALAVPAP